MPGTIIHGSGTLHYLNWIPVTCALNAADVTIDRDVSDARTFCGNNMVGGERKVGTVFGGFGVWGAEQYEEELTELMASGAMVDRLMTMGVIAGSQMYEVRGPLTKESFPFKAADILGLSGEIAGASTMTRGVLLDTARLITATGEGAGQNCGAVATPNTGVAVVRVEAVNGAGSITFQVKHSTTDGSYAQQTGLTVAVQGLAVAGTNEATFTGPGIARFTKVGTWNAWRQLSVTAYATFTSVMTTFTSGTQMPV